MYTIFINKQKYQYLLLKYIKLRRVLENAFLNGLGGLGYSDIKNRQF